MASETKVALVTGGGKRLGRQISLALAGAGYNIIVHHLTSREAAARTAGEIRALGVKALTLRADLGQPTQVDAMFRRAVRAFGRVDLLVNSASVYLPSRLLTTSNRIWQTTIATNLGGPFYCARAAARSMKGRKGGCIINIASLGGIQAWRDHLAYSVSKAGVIMLTKCLAKELAPNVRVNAVAPGIISMPGEEKANIRHLAKSKILLKRYGNPRDITDLVVFLATKAGYITGQVFSVDGGRSI